MRIRKNAKLSSILLSASSSSSHASQPETLQTLVCQLNQSPWDVISFSQESFQFEGEDSFTGNGSFGDSIGAVESSVASMMDGEDHKAVMLKVDDMVIDEDNDVEELDGMLDDEDDNTHLQIENEDKPLYCIKTHCKNESINGQNLCDHHSTKTCISNSSKKADKGISIGTTSGRRGRARAKKGSSSASNPYEFYYYSGFGPLWGKRRGGDRVNQGKKLLEGNNSYPDVKTSLSSSSLIDNGGLDYVDDYEDDDDDDEENGDTGKIKRMRKPVKARSLKSLM